MDYIKVVAQYKTSKDKENFARKHIKKTYIPYVEKLAEANRIANTCTHFILSSGEENEKNIYKKNTPMMRFLSMTCIITMYTDIECDQDKVVAMYDALSEDGLMFQLLSSIPETEVSEFMSLVDMCVSDIYENERELSTIVENKLEAISIVANEFFTLIGDTLSKDEVKNALEEKIKEFSTKEDKNE